MGAKLRIVLSMAIFGTVGVFVRSIPLSSGEIALYRAVIAAVVIALYQLVSGNRLKLAEAKRDLLPLFLSGAVLGFNWILLFQAYKYTTVSIATLSYYFAPVIMMIACPILFKEEITPLQIICSIMSTAGLVLITGVGGGTGSNDFVGICFGLGAAVLYATVVIVNKSIRHVAGIDRTLLQFLAAIAVLIPYVLATSGIHLRIDSGVGIACLLVLGVLHTGITYCLYFSSLRDVKGQEAAILSYVDPLVAVFISVFILHESTTAVQIIGGAMILGFTLLNELGGRRKQAPAHD